MITLILNKIYKIKDYIAKIKDYSLSSIILPILLILFLLFNYRNSMREINYLDEEIKELETEKSILLKSIDDGFKDIQKRNEELGVRNEELKGYIQLLEEQQKEDKCLSSSINANTRRLLHEAGI